MATEIKIARKSIKQYLSEYGPFTIPVYQRPYTWSEDEELQTLFDDLVEFVVNGDSEKREYFLGCIVSFNNKDKKQEIIDGQQRITTLFLILRAIYHEAYEEMNSFRKRIGFDSTNPSDGYKRAENFCNEIKHTLWQCDDETGEPFYEKILLESEVNNDETNAVLHKILETGIAEDDATDQYSKNYRRIQELLRKYSEGHKAVGFYDLVKALLNKTIVLPIWADDQEMALTIFDTLNNRGKPLSDADIFKAKIYESKSSVEEKSRFIADWKLLETEINQFEEESMQKLFTYYMYYLKGKENDNKTTALAVRKYFKGDDDSWNRLLAPDLIVNLGLIANVFKVVYRHQDDVDEPWASDLEIRKSLDILRYYPNEYWKYPVITYYIEHHNKSSFLDDFSDFLHNLISKLLTRFVYSPSLNYVKGDILKLDSAIKDSTRPELTFKSYDELVFKDGIQNPKDKITRMLLAVIAYNCGKKLDSDLNEKINMQKELLPEKWEIEHIFPQKYKKTDFPDMSSEQISEIIECIGNKIPLEKKINCEASDGFFDEKKKKYCKSSVALAKNLAENSLHDWGFDDINTRKVHTADAVAELMKKWDKA